MRGYKVRPLDDMHRLETVAVLRRLVDSERELGRLEGAIKRIPNEEILTGTLFIQEAKASSAIENIVTTQDEAFTSVIDPVNANAKEVRRYNDALYRGHRIVRSEDMLANRHILQLQAIVKENTAGFRSQTGTVLQDQQGRIVYTSPEPNLIGDLMANLERFINDPQTSELNPLVKMAIIHHQFESIHPFYDGNGRVGRMINVLYLCLQGRLSSPVLYLSRYLIDNKAEYYRLLQAVRDDGSWEEWILFMLKGIEETARRTVTLIEDISRLMTAFKSRIRQSHPVIYSQDLINALFIHPYTKIDLLSERLDVHRNTAARYLNVLREDASLKIESVRLGRTNYYLNTELIALFENVRGNDA